jgi:PAS domain S-box-containing protein
VVAVAMLAVGLPALRLIQAELEQQAEARVSQAASATEAIYAAQLREAQAFTTLSAERPTLQRLLRERDVAAFPPYLETLRATTAFDVLAVLDTGGAFIAQVPLNSVDEQTLIRAARMTEEGATPLVQSIPLSDVPVLAIVTSETVRSAEGTALGSVVGLIRLDESFLSELRRETGLHHSLYQNGELVVSTLAAAPQRPPASSGSVPIGGEPFYAYSLPLRSSFTPVVDVLALPAREMVAARARVLQILATSTLLVTALALLLSYLLAHRITAPLQHLAAASDGLGRGDLTTPIPPGEGIVEVNTLARTLEQMRRRLQTAYADLQRSKAWSENLIASLSEGVFTLDASSRISSFSPGAERVLGWQAVDVIGRPYHSVFESATGEPNAEQTVASLPPGTVKRLMTRTRSGAPITLLITSGTLTTRADGQLEQPYVFRDVTEEERALRLRETLLANVSHEFKTPLTALHAAVELLAINLPSLSQVELRELVDSLRQGTLRLEELVDNLLSSASLHTGHFAVRLRATDLEAVVEEVLLTTQPLLALQHQYLKLDVPASLPLVQADPRRISQVFINLISNASKYGPPGAPIVVRVRERDSEILVQVTDSGAGIPPEMQPALFQPFSRLDQTGRSGMGLGLSIVKAIVERHGGSVGLESVPSQGATFWFTLPLSAQTIDEQAVVARP